MTSRQLCPGAGADGDGVVGLTVVAPGQRTRNELSAVRATLPFSEPRLRNGGFPSFSPLRVGEWGLGQGSGLPGRLGVGAGQEPAISQCFAPMPPINRLPPSPASKHVHFLFYFFPCFLLQRCFA